MLRPVGDNLKVKVAADIYNFGGTAKGTESGVVVDVPDVIHYFGKHSMAFEKSFFSENLRDLLDYFRGFIGRQIIWETYQDRGRRFKEGDDEFVLLKMADIIGFTDNPNEEIKTLSDSQFNPGGMN